MKLFRFVLVGLSLLLLSLPAFAQDTQTIEWGDFGLAVDYPDDWDFDDSSDDEDISLVLFSGDLAIYFWVPTEGDDAEQSMENVIADSDNTEYEFSEIDSDIEIMGEEAFRVYFESETVSGFTVIFAHDGLSFMLNALVGDDRLSNRDEETLLEIVTTLHVADGSDNPPSGDAIETAADEDSSGEEIVEELVALDLVEDDGDFLFEEDEIEEGVFDFSEGYEGGNLAFGGWLSIELAEDDDDYRFCTFVAQSTTDDPQSDEGTMLITGFDSIGALIVYEYDIADEDNTVFEEFDAGVDVEDENHFLMIVQDDELWVYVNGELIVEAFELDISAGDDELFTGFVVGDGCTMENVWAYSFE